MAYITSQGVLDSQANQEIRHQLMQQSRLVSAIRLPNNLFTDGAGTEVGSDLIILQKRANRTEQLTQDEHDFIISTKRADGFSVNDYIFRNIPIIYTKQLLVLTLTAIRLWFTFTKVVCPLLLPNFGASLRMIFIPG